MNQGKIILAGGSGFLGLSLARELLAQGYEVVILTRQSTTINPGLRAVQWDGKTLGDWRLEFEGAKAVVNLTGRNVNCRYTEANLREINESRVNSVHVVAAAINTCRKPPEAWVQSSSLAFYGDAGDKVCDETSAPGHGIPVDTCLKWEAAFEESTTPRTRRVLLRISFVLGHGGGALRMLKGLTQCFLGGAIGNGRQYISWIHETDMNRLWRRAIEDSTMSGLYNATAPNAVSNAEFMREMRRALHRPWSPPLPKWLVPLGCFFLRTEPVLALTGRHGVPARLMKEGFSFTFPHLHEALQNLYHHPKTETSNPTLP
jgi:uncharacterized protein